jgi:biopolymer transport protein ExbB/TolQ
LALLLLLPLLLLPPLPLLLLLRLLRLVQLMRSLSFNQEINLDVKKLEHIMRKKRQWGWRGGEGGG